MSASLKHSLQAYTQAAIVKLTSQEEAFVLKRIQGLNPVAAAKSVGYIDPVTSSQELANRKEIDEAIVYMRETQRQTAIKAGAIEFTKDDATMLYLQAHAKCETAGEEIRAVDSLVKLHGLAAPEKKEITVTTAEQIQQLTDEQLMEMTGDDLLLSPEDYTVVDNE